MDANIQKYYAFLKVVEYGSFTEAARVLQYTQSGISHMISDLERDWGIVLMERGRTGVKLTSDGMTLLPYAQGICDAHSRMEEEINEINGLQTGLIRIGALGSVAIYVMPMVLKKFQEAYPNIKYEILVGDFSEIEEWISKGRIDLAFTKYPARSGFYTKDIGKDELKAVIPPDHPLKDVDAFPLEELEKYPFFMLEGGGENEAIAFIAENDLSPDVRFTTVDGFLILSMVEDGLGMALLPELLVHRERFHVIAKSLEKPKYRRLCVSMKNEQSVSSATRKLLDYIDSDMVHI